MKVYVVSDSSDTTLFKGKKTTLSSIVRWPDGARDQIA